MHAFKSEWNKNDALQLLENIYQECVDLSSVE